MKQTTILTAFLMTITANLLGQDFATIGTEWFYSGNLSIGTAPNLEYWHYESVADTVINGQTTHKITQTYFNVENPHDIHGDTVALAPIYLYQNGDTVFTWNNTKSEFLITFIFNGKVGDTLTLDILDTAKYGGGFNIGDNYRLVIDTVITDVVDGVSLKRYGTIALDNYGFFMANGVFMDRIGGLGCLLPSSRSPIPEKNKAIRCFSNAQIDTNFQNVKCRYLKSDSLPNSLNSPNSPDKNISVYPNPTSDFVTVKSNQPIKSIELFTLRGQRVAKSTEMTIDLADLATGLYYLKILFPTGESIEKKIIKEGLDGF